MTHYEIAQTLDQAAHTATSIEQLAAENNINLDEAYGIQRLSIDRRLDKGESIVGYKLGFTSYAKMEQMGVHDLIWGILTDAMTISPQAEVHLNRWIHPRAEPEIAFRVSQDITKPIALENISAYIDKMAPAIEVIDSRYKNFKFSLEDVVADNCSSTGYVIGDWQDLKTDISDLAIQLKVDHEVVEEGRTSAILNNPLQSVVELSRLASQAGLTVQKGHVIMAGAATAAVYLKNNQHIEANVENMGKVSFKVK